MINILLSMCFKTSKSMTGCATLKEWTPALKMHHIFTDICFIKMYRSGKCNNALLINISKCFMSATGRIFFFFWIMLMLQYIYIYIFNFLKPENVQCVFSLNA